MTTPNNRGLKYQSAQARLVDLIALIRKKPRTKVEVVDLWQVKSHSKLVGEKFDLLHAEGLIYIVRWTRRFTKSPWIAEYAWQSNVFEMPDAPLPLKAVGLPA